MSAIPAWRHSFYSFAPWLTPMWVRKSVKKTFDLLKSNASIWDYIKL